MKVEHTEVIDRPLAEVWEVFEDPEATVEWQGNLLEYEQVEGSPDKVGSISHQTVKNAGVTSVLTVELLERKAKKLSRSYYEGAQAPFEVTNTFKELKDGSTEWKAVMDVKLNLLTKALGPVLKPIASELVKRNGRDFKQYVESR